MAFKLPPPIGSSYRLHKTIMAKFLSKIYYLPINNKEFLPFLGPSIYRRTGNFICHGIDYTYRNISNILLYNKKNTSRIEDIRSKYFSHNLRDVLYDVLLKSNSFSITLFGKNKVEELINNHVRKKNNYLELLGVLLTMEHWSDLISQACNMAADKERASHGDQQKFA
jgi:hypothetical protein